MQLGPNRLKLEQRVAQKQIEVLQQLRNILPDIKVKGPAGGGRKE